MAKSQGFLRPPWAPPLLGDRHGLRPGGRGSQAGCSAFSASTWSGRLPSPCPATLAPEYGPPLGLSRCPSSSTCEASAPGLSGPLLPAKPPRTPPPHLPAIHSRFTNRVLGGPVSGPHIGPVLCPFPTRLSGQGVGTMGRGVREVGEGVREVRGGVWEAMAGVREVRGGVREGTGRGCGRPGEGLRAPREGGKRRGGWKSPGTFSVISFCSSTSGARKNAL